MKDPRVEQAKTVARNPYAWPGGYPIVLVMSDGGVLCSECVKKEFRQIVDSTKHGYRDGWAAEGYQVEEGPDTDVICDHCSKVIAEGSETE